MVPWLNISVTLLVLVQLLPSSTGFPSGCGCGCCGCCCGCGSPPARQNGGCSSNGGSMRPSSAQTTFRPPIYPHAMAEYCEDDGGSPTGLVLQTNSAAAAGGGGGGGGGEGSEAHQRSGVKGYLNKKQAKGPVPTLPPEIAKNPSSLSPPQLETFTNPSVKSGAPDYSG